MLISLFSLRSSFPPLRDFPLVSFLFFLKRSALSAVVCLTPQRSFSPFRNPFARSTTIGDLHLPPCRSILWQRPISPGPSGHNNALGQFDRAQPLFSCFLSDLLFLRVSERLADCPLFFHDGGGDVLFLAKSELPRPALGTAGESSFPLIKGPFSPAPGFFSSPFFSVHTHPLPSLLPFF